MPTKRSAMPKIRAVLRLKFEGRLSHERFTATSRASKGAMSHDVKRATQRSPGWPPSTELDDAALEWQLVPQAGQGEQHPHANHAHVHQEFRHEGVTLQLLRTKYRAV